MENYRIHYSHKTKNLVFDTIERFSNDILINNVTNDSVGITIESEDADVMYERLLDEINRQIKIAEEKERREYI